MSVAIKAEFAETIKLLTIKFAGILKKVPATGKFNTKFTLGAEFHPGIRALDTSTR